MSAPPDHPDRTPQSSAVRLVPYAPPRPSEEDQAQSGADAASAHSRGTDQDQQSTSSARGRHYTKAPPTSLAAPISFAKRRDDGVSERGPATIRRISTTDPKSGSSATDTPVSPSSNLPSLNAPSRGRLSTTSYASQSSRQSASSHLGDAEPSSSSVTSSTPSGPRRPQSRARNFVAVLNEDKTFSLVPQRHRDPEPQPQNPPRSSSALSEYGSPGLRSSQLPSFPITPRFSQASSHEGYSSYASSHYDRPSSSLAGTIPDRSVTPSTPVPSSPGSSTQETITENPITDPSALSWNYRMFGGLRRVPNLPTPDTKGKQPAHSPAPGSDTTETPPLTAPEIVTTHDGNRPDTRSTEAEQESIHSRAPSAGSDSANYRVFSGASEAPPETRPHEEKQHHHRGSDESLVDPQLREQASFATDHTASTEFESSNYKIYSNSDDEGSDEALAESPTEGPSSPAKRNLFVPQIQPQASIGSIQSGVSSVSDNTNYRVYGSPSPALTPVPESEPLPDQPGLRPAPSFLSVTSTTYETDNYKVYGGRISPVALSSVESFNLPSPSGSNAPLLRSPSAVPSLYTQEEEDDGPPGTATITVSPNYVVHGDPSPEATPEASPEPSPGPSREPSRDPSRDVTPNSIESGGTIVRHPREEYSQDSLVVSPLRPSRGFEETFGYYRARARSLSGSKSKEDLKTKKSLKSVKSSVSSAINEEEAESFYAAQAYLDAPAGEYETAASSVPGPSERQRQLDEQRERERQERESSAWEGAGAASGSQGAPMALPTTPHQWSSQLSTVMSESEPDSSTGGRNSMVSAASPGGSHERRSSRGWSSHSRQMLSISSSLAAELENASRSRSNSNSQPGSGSLERPGPAYRGYHGQVRDHDEFGDGLGDLHQISPRPSRTRLSDMFTNSNSSERSLHTSASSRSFNNGIPLWAKLYYGSGERRFLRSASISSASDLSRPGSAVHHPHNSMSPVSEHYPMGIYSPRRRPRESTGLHEVAYRRSTTGSMDIQPVAAEDEQELGFRRSLRRMTSSLWSPHLRRDLRARNRYSIWDTPSVAWSAESGMFGRRNLQVVLFVVGFIFPFAWMIGAVLPLPKPSPLAMVERDSSYSDLAVRPQTQAHEYERHIESVDELRYENARWWRMLNRIMSVVGLLIIAAVVTLVVLALKEGWGTHR